MDSKLLKADRARSIATGVLIAYGASEVHSRTVANHLVDSDLSGVPSHGLLRLPQYVAQILSGRLSPEATPVVRPGIDHRFDVLAQGCFGQVACQLGVEESIRRASATGLALGSVIGAGHAGRLGAYAEHIGREGFLALIFCSGPRSLGHQVAPFNGRQGRLATNPLAFAIPTGGEPIVGDFSTAAAPEGRIRYLRNMGFEAPPDLLLDRYGVPTTDPNVLYDEDPGTILPFGGLRAGHRGFALGLLVEAFATLLPGERTTDPRRFGNNVSLLTVSVDPNFAERATDMADYVLSSEARAEHQVMLPGIPELRSRLDRDTIQLDAETWHAIVELAARRNALISED